MPTGAFLPGYLVYILMIFLPGIGLGELLGAWRKEDILAEKVAFAFGLGLAFDTLVFLVRTSGLSVSGIALRGMEPATVYFIIGAGLAALLFSLFGKGRFDFPQRPSRVDLILLLGALAQGAVIMLWFAKYPIFPGFDSPDYATHVELAQGLISGTTTSIPGGILYYGVHYQLASVFLLVGGENLVAAQRTLAVLVVLSPFLVYLATKRAFSSTSAGLAATAIYSLSGTVWFNSAFTVGLYANLFGMLASLFFLVSFLVVAEGKGSVHRWSIFVLGLVMLYFSHYSSLAVFSALVVVSAAKVAVRRPDARRFLVPTLVALVPPALAVAAFPSLKSTLAGLLAGTQVPVFGGTPLSGASASVPVLSLMALEVSNDTGFVVLLILTVILTYKAVRSKKAVPFIPLVWLLSLVVVGVAIPAQVRFSFSALLPLTMVAGSGLALVLPGSEKPRRERSRRAVSGWRHLGVAVVLVTFLAPIVFSSWSQFAVADATTSTGDFANAQQQVYSSMYWLRDNTPADSRYLSVTDWRFVYTDIFFGRTTDVVYIPGRTAILAAAHSNGDKYVIVTDYVIGELSVPVSAYPWNTLKESQNLTLVYSNEDVRIFKVT